MVADKDRIRYFSVLTVLLFIALILSARIVYLFIADANRFPIHTVKIVGSYQHIKRSQIETILAQYLPYGFFALPVRKLYTDLDTLEWSKDVRVDRIWPDVLKITLIEKVPVAKWHDGYISESGEHFNIGQVLDEMSLPDLDGPDNQQLDVLQMYQNLSKILSKYGLHASRLKLRKNQAWELTLTNGVVLRLGKQDLEKRVERFCKAYPAMMADKPEQVASVDLRYERGMAVRWKNKQDDNG